MAKQMKYVPSFGSISEATHRNEDLIGAFFSEASQRFPKDTDVKEIDAVLVAMDLVGHYLDGDATDEMNQAFYDSDTVSEWVNETLPELLNSDLPAFMHFGTHEGDGACFGYWFSNENFEESVADGETLKVSVTLEFDALSTKQKSGYSYVAQVSDHGNIELYEVRKIGRGYGLKSLYGIV